MSRVSLGEAVDVIRGVSFEKNEAMTTARPGYLPILRAGNIQDELLLDRDLIWVPPGRVSPIQRLQAGDIAIAVSSGSSALVGKTAILSETWDGSVGAFCAIIRPRSNVNPHYLAHWFRGPVFESWRSTKIRGSNIQNLQLSEIAALPLELPAADEQMRLASALHKRLDAARTARLASHMQRELAELVVPAELKRAFFGIAPVSAGAMSPPGPGAWKWARLESLARLESGHTPSRRHPEWWGGKVPWLALPDIRKLHGKYAYETTECTNDAGLANSAARLLPVGTVCLCRDASIGFVTILGKPMATSQHFCNWVCDPEKLDAEFLMYAFMASHDYLRELGSGSVLKTIYMSTIESFQICAPDIDEQRRIARMLRERFAAAESLQASLHIRHSSIERLPERILASAFATT